MFDHYYVLVSQLNSFCGSLDTSMSSDIFFRMDVAYISITYKPLDASCLETFRVRFFCLNIDKLQSIQFYAQRYKLCNLILPSNSFVSVWFMQKKINAWYPWCVTIVTMRLLLDVSSMCWQCISLLKLLFIKCWYYSINVIQSQA